MEAVTTISARDNGGGSGCHLRRCHENEVAAVAQLKKILEWELSLDARDLISHAWYHGAISRTKAEHIVGEQDGDFLVRDCTSQPGNYVLSCRSKGQNLHFVINKMVLQANTVYESVQYRFEDDGFDTVPDLITYYVGSGKPITNVSGAKIQNPRNRRHPLFFYSYNANGEKYDLRNFETRWQPTTATGTLTSTSTLASSTAAASKTPTTYRGDSAFKKQRSFSLRLGDVGAVTAVSSSVTLPQTPDITRTKNNYWRDSNRTADRYSFSNSLPRPSGWAITGSRSPSTESSNVNAILPGSDSDSGSSCSTYVNAKVVGARNGCAPLQCECKDCANGCDGDYSDVGAEPPPKPSRRITVHSHSDRAAACGNETPKLKLKPPNNCLPYAAYNNDSGNGSDDLVRSCNATAAADAPKTTFGVVIENPKYDDNDKDGSGGSSSLNRDRVTSDEFNITKAKGSWTTAIAGSGGHHDDDQNDISYGMFRMRVHTYSPASAFDLEAFHTLLLPTVENKPLDTCTLQSVHMLLMDSGSRILANHLTRADLELTVGEFIHHRRRSLRQDADTDGDYDYDPLICKTGIELSFLPQGRRHRYDLIERSECLRLLVAVTILTCATESERAELLNKWILVAIDTKTALGNLYGFCSIMLGLCTPQVLRLKETWHILRQRYTDSAFNFEAKLRPTFKCMNESTNPLAPNTTIPHLLPTVLLYETNYAHISSNNDDEDGDDVYDDYDNTYHVFAANSHLWDVCINQWEACSPDLGLGTLYSHLNATRHFYNLLPTFKRNAEIVLTDSKIDHLLSDLFRTEFHMKFLWGSRGAKVNASERYPKFQQVLNVMSEKCETIDYDDRDHDDHDTGNGSVFAISQSPQWYSCS